MQRVSLQWLGKRRLGTMLIDGELLVAPVIIIELATVGLHN